MKLIILFRVEPVLFSLQGFAVMNAWLKEKRKKGRKPEKKCCFPFVGVDIKWSSKANGVQVDLGSIHLRQAQI